MTEEAQIASVQYEVWQNRNSSKQASKQASKDIRKKAWRREMVHKACLGFGTLVLVVGLVFNIMTATIESWVLAEVDGVEACSVEGDTPLGSLGLFSASYDPTCVAGVPQASSFEFFPKSETKTVEFFPLFPTQTAFGGALSNDKLTEEGAIAFVLDAGNTPDVTSFESCEDAFEAGGAVENRAAALAAGEVYSGLVQEFDEQYDSLIGVAGAIVPGLQSLFVSGVYNGVELYLDSLVGGIASAVDAANLFAANFGYSDAGTDATGTGVCAPYADAVTCLVSISGSDLVTAAGQIGLEVEQLGTAQALILGSEAVAAVCGGPGATFAACVWGGEATRYNATGVDTTERVSSVQLEDNPVFAGAVSGILGAPVPIDYVVPGSESFAPLAFIFDVVCPSGSDRGTWTSCKAESSGLALGARASIPQTFDASGSPSILAFFLELAINESNAAGITTAVTQWVTDRDATPTQTSWTRLFQLLLIEDVALSFESVLPSTIANDLDAAGLDLPTVVGGISGILSSCAAAPDTYDNCVAEIPQTPADKPTQVFPDDYSSGATAFPLCFAFQLAGLTSNCHGGPTLLDTLGQIDTSVSSSLSTFALLRDGFLGACATMEASIGVSEFPGKANLLNSLACFQFMANPALKSAQLLLAADPNDAVVQQTVALAFPNTFKLLVDLGIDQFPPLETSGTDSGSLGVPGVNSTIEEAADREKRISLCSDNDEDIRRIKLAQVLIPTALASGFVSLGLAIAAMVVDKGHFAIISGLLSLAAGVMVLSAFLLVLNAPVYAPELRSRVFTGDRPDLRLALSFLLSMVAVMLADSELSVTGCSADPRATGAGVTAAVMASGAVGVDGSDQAEAKELHRPSVHLRHVETQLALELSRKKGGKGCLSRERDDEHPDMRLMTLRQWRVWEARRCDEQQRVARRKRDKQRKDKDSAGKPVPGKDLTRRKIPVQVRATDEMTSLRASIEHLSSKNGETVDLIQPILGGLDRFPDRWTKKKSSITQVLEGAKMDAFKKETAKEVFEEWQRDKAREARRKNQAHKRFQALTSRRSEAQKDVDSATVYVFLIKKRLLDFEEIHKPSAVSSPSKLVKHFRKMLKLRQAEEKLTVALRKQADAASLAVESLPAARKCHNSKPEGTRKLGANPVASSHALRAFENLPVQVKILGRFKVALEEEHVKLKVAFQRFDESSDGCISRHEFASMIGSMDKDVNQAQACAAFNALDVDGSGVLSFREVADFVKSVSRDTFDCIRAAVQMEREQRRNALAQQFENFAEKVAPCVQARIAQPDLFRGFFTWRTAVRQGMTKTHVAKLVSEIRTTQEALKLLRTALHRDKAKFASMFHDLDTTGDGRIDQQELAVVLDDLGFGHFDQCKAGAETIIRFIDQDGSATLDYFELARALKSNDPCRASCENVRERYQQQRHRVASGKNDKDQAKQSLLQSKRPTTADLKVLREKIVNLRLQIEEKEEEAEMLAAERDASNQEKKEDLSFGLRLC
ncbi:Calmodulin [Durusdinium trenchii]|uniref:Calmodulin n=1 Tax=Durusdinium trenchii TaxID=1381693 RepID=A0ABP0RQF1_9DINO